MAGMIDDGDDVIANINMVPFIDIALVLLIIFMVTSSYIVQQAIEVRVPAAASGGEVAASTLGIEVPVQGSILLNGDPIERDALLGALRREVSADAAIQAMIAADRETDYGRVMDVVDLVIQAGIRTYALNVERRPEEGTPP